MKVLLVVEDEPDIRLLVRVNFALDPRFQVDGEASTADEAIALVLDRPPDLIVLDHELNGETTGMEAAPVLKAAAPAAVVILFSASEELRVPAKNEPSIDAFLLKTEIHRLVPLAVELLHL